MATATEQFAKQIRKLEQHWVNHGQAETCYPAFQQLWNSLTPEQRLQGYQLASRQFQGMSLDGCRTTARAAFNNQGQCFPK
jgi:hypothetical protein